jgi:hypothetical protein
MSKRGIVWVIVVGIGLIVSYFTVSSSEAVKWNDKVVAQHRRFGSAWERMQPMVETWLEGEAIDGPQMDQALEQYVNDIGRIAADMRKETPPNDDLCKAMHVELVKFADLQEAQLAEVKKLCGEMKAANPGKPEEIKRVSDALNALGAKEEAQQSIVRAKQAAMAAKFKLKMR